MLIKRKNDQSARTALLAKQGKQDIGFSVLITKVMECEEVLGKEIVCIYIFLEYANEKFPGPQIYGKIEDVDWSRKNLNHSCDNIYSEDVAGIRIIFIGQKSYTNNGVIF